jgi:predicted DsbA family dithiol-disulfide isomerase
MLSARPLPRLAAGCGEPSDTMRAARHSKDTMPIQFALTYDYLCPFACIANEVVVDALHDGVDWQVEFVPFSLAQTKVEEGEPAVWERAQGAAGTRGVLAHQWSLAVRDSAPTLWSSFHVAVYRARFQDAADLEDPEVLARVAGDVGLDPATITEAVAGGEPMAALAEMHTELEKRWSVFGVPTFIRGSEAVFVRFMERSREDVEKVVSMLDWVNVNEFKRTTIPR